MKYFGSRPSVSLAMGIQARSMMSARTSLHLPRFSAASSRLASSIQFSAPASVLGRSFTRPKPKSTPTSTLQRDARNQQRRSYGTPILDDHDSSRSRFQPRVSHLFIGLAVLGLFVTTYGLLEWYLSFDSWPPELRDELRKAIKARNRGDFIRSEVAFRKAIDIANELPLEKFGEDPLLKVTGIHISLAALLENGGQQRKALEVLQGAMEWMDRFDPRLPTSSSFSSSSSDASTSTPIISNTPSGEPISWGIKDRTRSIGLLQKLGSISLYLAETVPARSDTYLNQAESYLTRALTSMIELGASEAAKKAAAASAEALAVGTSQGSEKHPSQVVGRDFLFPSESSPNDSDSMPDVSRDNLGTGGKAQSLDKVTKRSMGLVMESLADVYVRKGKYEFANALYVQAISTLLPPKNEKNPVKPSVMDTCQAAMLMNSLSSSLLNPPTSEQIKAARSWSARAVQLSEEAMSRPTGPSEEAQTQEARYLCEQARIVGEFNLGSLAEMESDIPQAIRLLTRSQTHARDAGFSQGAREAGDALRRLKGLNRAPSGAK